jgi:tetratricopeptide (TPR) repeat protein
MNLISAKCPNCGGELQLPENRTSVSCIYCDTKIIVSEAVKQKGKDIEPLIKLMQDAFDAKGNGEELIKYANKVLEIDSNNALAMFYKGLAYYWQSKFKEGLIYIEKSLQIDSSNEFKTKIYEIIINWSKRAFDTIYYRWNVSPGTDKYHCNTLRNRLGYDKDLLMDLDRTYAFNTKEVIKLVEFAIKLFPKKADGHFVILRKLNDFSSNNYSWSSVISRHELRLKELGKPLPNNSKKKSGCFIATATMGSYDHPQVMELRHFRDEWILEKSWGGSFVKWYYHFGSIAAKYIENSFLLKKISYCFIVKPLVYLARILKK